MTIEDEIRLLKEKVALLEKVIELRDLIEKAIPYRDRPSMPGYPVYPTYPYQPYITWTTSGTTKLCLDAI